SSDLIWSYEIARTKKPTNTGEEILIAEEFYLVARSRANTQENVYLTSESININRDKDRDTNKDVLPFDRIKTGNDLYAIQEHYSDGSSVHAYVWDGEGTHNPLQTTYINQETGELFLVISKENNAYDFFKSWRVH
ncbi:hypothetical protein LIP24_10010, partial [Collinsella aerofaciens]|uniref:hypothetical protein n=1 Tax=Collinsella aerofaciens TaxID=74426 RepID=UPI001D023728